MTLSLIFSLRLFFVIFLLVKLPYFNSVNIIASLGQSVKTVMELMSIILMSFLDFISLSLSTTILNFHIVEFTFFLLFLNNLIVQLSRQIFIWSKGVTSITTSTIIIIIIVISLNNSLLKRPIKECYICFYVGMIVKIQCRLLSIHSYLILP